MFVSFEKDLFRYPEISRSGFLCLARIHYNMKSILKKAYPVLVLFTCFKGCKYSFVVGVRSMLFRAREELWVSLFFFCFLMRFWFILLNFTTSIWLLQ